MPCASHQRGDGGNDPGEDTHRARQPQCHALLAPDRPRARQELSQQHDDQLPPAATSRSTGLAPTFAPAGWSRRVTVTKPISFVREQCREQARRFADQRRGRLSTRLLRRQHPPELRPAHRSESHLSRRRKADQQNAEQRQPRPGQHTRQPTTACIQESAPR